MSVLILVFGLSLSALLFRLSWKILRADPNEYRRLHNRTYGLGQAIRGQVRALPGPGPDRAVVKGGQWNKKLQRFEMGARISDEAIDHISK